jgi:hypothetical protein
MGCRAVINFSDKESPASAWILPPGGNLEMSSRRRVHRLYTLLLRSESVDPEKYRPFTA